MEINKYAMIVATLVPMILGFIWYHPKVFGTIWMRASGVTEAQTKTGNMAVIFGLSLLFSFMLAYAMNLIAFHDAFIGGALYYVTDGTMIPESGSEAAKWQEYYKTTLAASNHTFKHGAFHGFMIGGLLMALPIMAINALFERRGVKYVAVNAGYWLVCLTLMGGIIAAWR